MRVGSAALLALALLLPAACDGGGGRAAPGTSATSEPGEARAGGVEECRPAPPPPEPRAVAELQTHVVTLGTTEDGLTVSGARGVLEGGSVPDGVRLPEGTVLVYFVNADDGSTWVGEYEDGTLEPLEQVEIDAVAGSPTAVDPDATAVEGGVRLAYFASFGPIDPGREAVMCIADSEDGVHFESRAAALSFEGVATDPTLVRLAGGD